MANNTVYIISQKISPLLFVRLWETSYAYAVSKKDTLASSKKGTILLRNIKNSENRIMKYRCCYLTAEPAATASYRVAMADFWRTFHHDGKMAAEGGGTRPPSFTLYTITYKVAVCAPIERVDTLPLFLLYPCIYSVCMP